MPAVCPMTPHCRVGCPAAQPARLHGHTHGAKRTERGGWFKDDWSWQADGRSHRWWGTKTLIVRVPWQACLYAPTRVWSPRTSAGTPIVPSPAIANVGRAVDQPALAGRGMPALAIWLDRAWESRGARGRRGVMGPGRRRPFSSPLIGFACSPVCKARQTQKPALLPRLARPQCETQLSVSLLGLSFLIWQPGFVHRDVTNGGRGDRRVPKNRRTSACTLRAGDSSPRFAMPTPLCRTACQMAR